ncbi:MAG: glycosyltransferase family 2 protein [Cryomorphaceae bacterium]|nr:glycosyltransferase family 2 protein [Cryomorphaceae bacterium]
MGGSFDFFEYYVFFYASSMFLLYIYLGFSSFIAITRYRRYNSRFDDDMLLTSPLIPGISVVAPAYNEEKTIIVNVKSLLTLEYPLFEVVIVNDGSKDKTLDLLIDEFELEETEYAYVEKIKTKPFKRIFKSKNPKYSILTVVDKENGGTKADASNAGINASQYPYFLCTDVDCILARDTLSKMIKPVLNSTTRVVGVGATLRMSNSCDIEDGVITRVRPPKRLIPRFQEIEYLRAYLFGKMGWSLLNCVPNISGGLGLYERDVAVNAGGYDGESHAEDMDMMTKVISYMINNNEKYKIEYIPISCCWTEGPPTVNVLGRQRTRWGTGLAQFFIVHRKIFLNPRYGRLGMFVFPTVFLYEFLAPIIEAFGFIYFILLILKNDVNWDLFYYIFFYSYTFGIFISTMVLYYDNYVQKHYQTFRETLSLWLTSFLEPFIYHPLIVFFALRGYFNFFTSREREWGAMTRQGFDSTEKKKEKAIEEATLDADVKST